MSSNPIKPAPARWAGFTLLEALVVIAIIAIVAAIAVPSFRATIASNRLTATANAYVSNFNNARSLAIRRNTQVQFCSDGGDSGTVNGTDTLGTYCTPTTVKAGDVYMSVSGSSSLAIAAPALPPGLTTASSKALRFNGQGLARDAVGSGPYTGLVVDLSTNQLSNSNHRCICLSAGSTLSVVTPNATGACSAITPSPCQ